MLSVVVANFTVLDPPRDTVADDRSQLLTWLSPWSPGYVIEAFKSAASTTLGNGSCKQKNSEGGMTGVGKVKVIRQSCLALGILGLARHSLGNKDYS